MRSMGTSGRPGTLRWSPGIQLGSVVRQISAAW